MTTAVTQDHIEALDKAKFYLMRHRDSAFYTTILFSLKLVWDDRIPTACTNGREIRFNPAFFMSLTKQEQVFLMLHEALHVAYLHMIRRGDRDPARWNAACDYVINLGLVDRGYTMPKMGLLDRAYAGMGTEQVYPLLPEMELDKSLMDLESGDGSQDESLTQEVEEILIRAAIQSKLMGDKPGTIPGDIEVYLDKLLNPRLPWTKLLRRYFSNFAKDDYSWRKFNRRFFPRHYLPGLHSERLMNLAVAVDISGSVSDADFKVFVSEVASILRMMKPEKITFIQFDTRLQHIDEIKSVHDLMALEFHGRGGTDVTPVMDWARDKKPQVLLLFSDGEFHIPEGPAPAETLWVIHNNPTFKPNFGEVIHYAI